MRSSRADEHRRATAALGALADLTPAGKPSATASAVPLDWFRWLPGGLDLLTALAFPDPFDAGMVDKLLDNVDISSRAQPEAPRHRLDGTFGERLAAVQQVRSGRHAVRVGWLWVAGSITEPSAPDGDGVPTRRQVFAPLVTRTVRVVGRFTRDLVAYGDVEITPLIADRSVARELEARIEYGGGAIERFADLTPALFARLTRLQSFATAAAAAAGLPATQFTLGRVEPEEAMRTDGLRIIVGLGVYTTDEVGRFTRAGSLDAWASKLGDRTAFHAVYAPVEIADPAAHAEAGAAAAHDVEIDGVDAGERVEAPMPLNPGQRRFVARARHADLAVLSGAPGTGKSHTLVAVVADTLSRGGSVLITAKHDAAVDALLALLARYPALEPVVFGSSAKRSELARRLTSGELGPADPTAVRRAAAALTAARAGRDDLTSQARRLLRPEYLRSPAGRGAVAIARRQVPGAAHGDLAELESLVTRAGSPARGWWRGRDARRARRVLRQSAAVVDGQLSDASICRDVALVVDARHAETAAHLGGAPGDPARFVETCAALDAAEREVEQRFADWLALEVRAPERFNRAGRSAVGTLATALRSGRHARRAQLERLTDDALTHALPVWIGTLGDVDDLLPAVPGLFDLVIVDEASATEQTVVAPALLRARRAVIAGDPRQLRHVSFVADATIAEAHQRHGVAADDRSRLDTRRNSMFDAAAASAGVELLDEHFRSAPHLIDVVARRLYGGRLTIATRSPATDRLDCVHLRAVEESSRVAGVVDAEIRAVVTELRRLSTQAGSVGVTTPFRAQADALEHAVLAAFTSEELERMNLRIDTVHGFQGNERDTIVCSLGLVDGDRAGWSFAEDPHLLAVMLTRARRSMVLVAGCSPTPGSILADYLAAADQPPGRPASALELSEWAATIVADLHHAGLDPAPGYPTGRHLLDAAIAMPTPVGLNPETAAAIVCHLHPAGAAAHIERHLSLRRAGWTVVEALPTLWGERQPELTAALVARLRRSAYR